MAQGITFLPGQFREWLSALELNLIIYSKPETKVGPCSWALVFFQWDCGYSIILMLRNSVELSCNYKK